MLAVWVGAVACFWGTVAGWRGPCQVWEVGQTSVENDGVDWDCNGRGRTKSEYHTLRLILHH